MEETNLYKNHEQYCDEKSQSHCVREQRLWLFARLGRGRALHSIIWFKHYTVPVTRRNATAAR